MNSCTYTGVPRNTHTNTQAALLITGLGDSRITASTTPSTRPITIARNVSTSVTRRP